MSYIKHVLQPGETVRYQGSVHWVLYVPAILLGSAALVIVILTAANSWRYGWLAVIACGIHFGGSRLVGALDNGDRGDGSPRDLCARLYPA